MGWQPNTHYKPGTPIRSDDLNSIAQAAARGNGTPFECDGLHTADRSYLSQAAGGTTNVIYPVKMKEPLAPGAYDFPARAIGYILIQGGSEPDSLEVSTDEIDVVNYSPNIFAPKDGFVIVEQIYGVNVAKHSAC